MIKLTQVSLQRGTKFLLTDASLTVFPKQKWGIIGANGAGKSSLFKLILRELHEDSGTLNIPQDWTIAHMAQEISNTSLSALDYVLNGDQELRELEKQIENSDGNGNKLAQLFEKMEHIDGYTAKSRAEKLLYGLGFSSNDTGKTVNDFSGGWRIRLNLAQALMCRSDLLLLDEPTNHLDLDATIWLEQWLINYPGTLLVISHDRDFLDNVIDHTVNFENARLVEYTGNYSAYERQKAERLAQQAQAFEKQQARIADIENFVRRFRAKATKAKQAQSRLKELERMEKIAPAHIDSPFNFTFYEPEKLPETLISLDSAEIGYNTPIVANVELSILASTRLGLLGFNGAGKSTLLKSLANEIDLINGRRHEATHLKLGYFAQHQIDSLDMSASCYLHIARISPEASEQQIRNFLGGFDFQGDRAFEQIEHFSGGEKARLALAILVWQQPNLLLLDEPTNHLDLEMRHALTLALQNFAGAIVIVSHDRHLLKNTVDSFALVHNGKLSNFDGSIDDYEKWLAQHKITPGDHSSNDKPSAPSFAGDNLNEPNGSSADKKAQRQAAAQAREKLRPLTNAVKKLESKIEKLQAELVKVETKLADPALYEGESEKLTQLLKEQGTLKSEIEDTEEQWFEKQDELESLKEAH